MKIITQRNYKYYNDYLVSIYDVVKNVMFETITLFRNKITIMKALEILTKMNGYKKNFFNFTEELKQFNLLSKKKEINRKVEDINNNDSNSNEKLLQLVKNKTEKIPKIQSPDEVKKLMEDLWINHKAGNKTLKNNVFRVKLPTIEKS